jgi:hypothetical protein
MPTATAKNIRALKITSILTGGYFIIELRLFQLSSKLSLASVFLHTPKISPISPLPPLLSF